MYVLYPVMGTPLVGLSQSVWAGLSFIIGTLIPPTASPLVTKYRRAARSKQHTALSRASSREFAELGELAAVLRF